MALKGLSAVRAGLARPSGWILVAVNLGILLAVLYFGWSVFDVMFLFWAENVIIGIINIFKMIFAFPLIDDDKTQLAWNERLAAMAVSWSIRLILIPFFIFHYGGFCLGHGIFMLAFFKEFGEFDQSLFTVIPALFTGGLAFPLILLAASHLYSFVFNYLGGGEYRQATPMSLMVQPYGRIIALHIAILLGGFLTMALGDQTWMLVILILLKTLVDLAMHGRERQKYIKEQWVTS